MKLPRYPFAISLFAIMAFTCLTAGCTTANSSHEETAGADEEYVQPTGSRISQRVKKGTGGIAKDMAGGTTGGGTIQRAQQNDGGNVSSSSVPSTK